jgi:hypothetical protein
MIAAIVAGCGSGSSSTEAPVPEPAAAATPSPAPIVPTVQATLGLAMVAPDGLVAAAMELSADEMPPTASSGVDLDTDDLPPKV